jgi:hypothetical protein
VLERPETKQYGNLADLGSWSACERAKEMSE